MSRLFKPKSCAYCLMIEGERVYRDADGRRVKKATPGAVKVELGVSGIWWGKYKDAAGAFKNVKLCSDKAASKQLLAKLETDARLAPHGLGDRNAEHRKTPLANHLADWAADLRAGGATDQHVRQTAAGVRRVLDGCGFIFSTDMTAPRVRQFLADLRARRPALPAFDPALAEYTRGQLASLLAVKPSAVPSLVRRHRLEAVGNGKARRYPRATADALRALRSRGCSVKTSNLYLAAVKQFAAWMVKERRMAHNPLADMEGGNVKQDRRHDRRPLAPEELRAVIGAAAASEVSFREQSGRDRAMLYAVACATGFRAAELASLPLEAFSLDADPPAVILSATNAKNGRTAVQPLPPVLVQAVRDFLADKSKGTPVWPGTWPEKGAEMFRLDLEAAGIPYAVEGPDGPLYADFHSLRHSFIALLDRSGATLKEAMQLARHSDPKLTMAVYGRAQLHDLAAAVGELPSLLAPTREGPSEVLSATGTDGRRTTAPHRAPTKKLRLDAIR